MSVPSPTTPELRRRERTSGLVGVAVLAVLLVVGLAWAKWLPYAAKVGGLLDTRAWPGGQILTAGGDAGAAPSWRGGWQFAVAYGEAVWKALAVALLVAAAVEALVPRGWLLGLLGRRSRLGQAALGGVVSTPTMMCTCCTAPVAVGLRRSGAPLAATLAYWVGNPLLNPAVLVFLLLVLPWPYAAVRLVVGVLVVVGGSALLARWFEARGVDEAPAAPAPAAPATREEPPRLRALPGRFLRSLARMCLVLVPEYAVVVLAVGLVSSSLADFGAWAQHLGVVAVLLVAAVATLLVVPTGGEIPVITAALAAGAGAGVAGVLLVALPALSLPSVVMVGRALGWRATWSAAGVVAVGALVAGGLVAALS